MTTKEVRLEGAVWSRQGSRAEGGKEKKSRSVGNV